MECRPICRILLLLLLCILIKDVITEINLFKAYISMCILGRAMKFPIQALQQYVYYPA